MGLDTSSARGSSTHVNSCCSTFLLALASIRKFAGCRTSTLSVLGHLTLCIEKWGRLPSKLLRLRLVLRLRPNFFHLTQDVDFSSVSAATWQDAIIFFWGG